MSPRPYQVQGPQSKFRHKGLHLDWCRGFTNIFSNSFNIISFRLYLRHTKQGQCLTSWFARCHFVMLQLLKKRKKKKSQRGGSSNELTFNFEGAAKSYFQQTGAEMQQECCYQIMYHHPKYFRNFSLSCRFFPPLHIFLFFCWLGVKCARWLMRRHSSKQENMQDVGGRGAGIWRAHWNSSGQEGGLASKTVVSQFLESQKCACCVIPARWGGAEAWESAGGE